LKFAGLHPGGDVKPLLPLLNKVCLLPDFTATSTHYIWCEKVIWQNVFRQCRHRQKREFEENPNCYAVTLLRLSSVWKSCYQELRTSLEHYYKAGQARNRCYLAWLRTAPIELWGPQDGMNFRVSQCSSGLDRLGDGELHRSSDIGRQTQESLFCQGASNTSRASDLSLRRQDYLDTYSQ
jgi:hypothetical protein